MRKAGNWTVCFLALLMLGATGFAETAEAPKFYKLDFVVKEVEGTKVLNARVFSMVASTSKGGQSSIRSGSRVPTPSSPGSNQFNNVELGVNIDCRSLEEVGSELSLQLTADVTTALQESTTLPPVVRMNRWSSNVVVPIRKTTVVFLSDDLTTKRQMQMELTATPIK